MLKNTGQIAIGQLIGWGIAIAVPTILASVGYSNFQIGKITDTQVNTLQRVSVVETKATQYEKDIEAINKKLDFLVNRLK